VGIACLLLGTVVLAVTRALCGTCYYKVLRTFFAQKTALLLTIIGAVTGLFPIVLFVASLRRQKI
jgi:ABC-type Co2+ transport system permease subunit